MVELVTRGGAARPPNTPSRPEGPAGGGDRHLPAEASGFDQDPTSEPSAGRLRHVGARPRPQLPRLPRSCIGQDEAGRRRALTLMRVFNDRGTAPRECRRTTAWPDLVPSCRAEAFGEARPDAVRGASEERRAGWLVERLTRVPL